jgi:hypothetical protein
VFSVFQSWDFSSMQAWKLFKEKMTEISENKTFQGVPLLFRGQQGRATRNVSVHSDEISSLGLLQIVCPMFAKFLADYVKELEKYFVPWPEWLRLTEVIFIFDNDTDDSFIDRLHFRLSNLDDLMKLPFRPEPLSQEEKTILREQYRTLFIAADEIFRQNENEKRVNNLIWYKICTTPSLYTPIKAIIHFALCFLVRDQNECSVESLIGDIQNVDSSDRPRISHETVTMQEFIKQNGPHPLMSEDLRRKALDSLFPSGWHFLSAERIGKFHSSTVSNHLQKAKEGNNFCFE